MNESKKWWQSRTIWGGLVSVIAGLAMMLGIQIDTASLTESIIAIATVVGGIVSVIFRKTATKRIE